MPIDPSIALQSRPPSSEGMMNAMQAGMQMKMYKNKLAQMQAEQARMGALRSYMGTHDLTTPEGRIGVNKFDPSGETFKNLESGYSSRATGAKAEFESALAMYNDFRRGLGGLAASNADRNTVVATINDYESRGILKPELAAHYRDTLPTDPAQLQARLKRGAMELASPDQIMAMFTPKIDFQTTDKGLEGIDVSPASPTFGQTRIRRGAEPKPPGAVVTINDKGNIAAAEGVVGSLIKTRESLAQAPVLWQNFEDAKALIKDAKGFMGAGGGLALDAASFLNNRFGTNIDVKGVKTATELNSRMFQGIVSTLKQLDSNPSQSQQEALRQAMGSVGTDPNALENVINVAQDILSNRVERYNKDATKASQKLDFPIDMPIEMPTRKAPTATGAPPPPPGYKIR